MPLPLPPGTPKRTGVNLTIDPFVARDLRAWSAASQVSQAKITDAALRKHLAGLVAGATEEERAAYVAAGGVIRG